MRKIYQEGSEGHEGIEVEVVNIASSSPPLGAGRKQLDRESHERARKTRKGIGIGVNKDFSLIKAQESKKNKFRELVAGLGKMLYTKINLRELVRDFWNE